MGYRVRALGPYWTLYDIATGKTFGRFPTRVAALAWYATHPRPQEA